MPLLHNRIVSFSACLYLFAQVSVAQQQNILNNGGFENGLMCYSSSIWSSTGAPYSSAYKFSLSPDSHSGANSLQITCAAADCLKAAIISDRVQTPPSQAYTLNLYAKCPAGRSAAVYVPWTAGGDTFQYLTCNDTWVSNRVNFTVGSSATDFYFYVYNRDFDWLRIDDIVLTYADGSVPQQAPLHAGNRNVNISGQTLSVDGSPYLALGFFDVAYEDLPRAASMGANTLGAVLLNASANCFNTWHESYLDRAYDLGLNFLPDSSTTARLQQPSLLAGAVQTFAPHLANIGWFLADEPDQASVPAWYIPPQVFLSESQTVKANTSLPVVADFQRAAWSTLSDTQVYSGSTDIWMAEPYGPDFSSVNHAINTFNTIKRQPIWLAQDPIDASLIVPKAYWAVIGGATGILYYQWVDFKADAAKLSAASQAFQELNQLKGVIFAPNADSQLTAFPGIAATARSSNGSTYILAANATASSLAGRIQFAGLTAGSQVTVLFENRTITADSGGFTDMFDGVSRHVYQLPVSGAAAPVAVNVTSTPPGVALQVDGATCLTPCTFQWLAGSSHNLGVAQSFQAASVGSQRVFTSWSDGGAQSHAVTAPASPSTFTANFATQYLLTTTASPAAGGTITAGGWYNSGTVVPVTAAANSGYTFAGFSGTLSGAAATQNLTMNAAANVTANFTAIVSGGGSGGSWYGAWTTRRKLTVNHTQVSGGTTLANFPVLVSMTDAELKSTGNAGKVGKIDGTDIVFTAADGVTKLNHEIESYDPAAGKLVAWVQAPSVSPSTDSVLYLYYGNAGSADQQNKTGVWDSGYRVVNHFKDAAGSDSTQYQNTALPSGNAAFTQAGVAGPAYSVDGVSGQLTIPYSSSWNSAFPSYTVEFWLKPGSLQDYSAALAVGTWGTPFNIWFFNPNFVVLRMDTTGGYCAALGSLPLDGAFHHLAMAYDSAQTRFTVYADGVAWPYPAKCTGNVALPAQALTLGRFLGGKGSPASFDELRISAGTPRSGDWITTGFTNQKSPASFYTVGTSETNGVATPTGTVVTSNPAGLSLTVDGAACTTPCSFSWSAGSPHTVSAASNAQYTFVSWSDGGAQSHSITAPNGVTANFSATAGTSSWYGAWTTRRKLTVNHTQVSGSTALANFPVLVSITDAELKSTGNAGKVGKTDGTDIVFTAADAVTKLNHEIESYDPAAGKLVAWVQAPSVSPSTDSVLYLYYGNAGSADQQNKTGVWDSGYRVVNHFKDAAGSDSTQYQNTATPSGNATLTPAGVAGPAYSVDGVSGQLTIPYSSSWNSAFPSYTVEFWLKPGALQDYSAALAVGTWGTPFNIWFFNPNTVVLRMDTTGGYCSANGPLPLDGAFHHLAMAYDSAQSRFTVYADGVAWPYPAKCTGNVALPAQALTLGRFIGGKGSPVSFDELRISAGTPRSGDWITTGFTNQKSPASFYAIGGSEAHP